MLLYYFDKLRENKIVNLIQAFLSSIWSIIFIVGLGLLSNLFGIEIFTYYVYFVIILIATLFADDLLCLVPISCCSYMTFAKKNNPLGYDQTSIFLEKGTQIAFIIVCVLIALTIIPRIIFEVKTKKERVRYPKLTAGFVILGLSYILGGIFSGHYDGRTAFFGLVQILALSFTYFTFYFLIDFRKVKKNYFAVLFTAIGFMLVGEVIGMLYYADFFTKYEHFNRGLLYTGWGVYNNIGMMMAMMIPAPVYFAVKQKNTGWLFCLVSALFHLATIFTQSRNSILVGTIVFIVCAILGIFLAKGKNKLYNFLAYFGYGLAILLTIYFAREFVNNIFYSLIQSGSSDSGRFDIYRYGFDNFLLSPSFGNGWYVNGVFQWGVVDENTFLPPRYHNTYIQIIATGGVAMSVAYLYHRFETAVLVFKNFTIEKLFMGAIIATLIVGSVLDCHFFNFGPGFIYSGVLLLLEVEDFQLKNKTANNS